MLPWAVSLTMSGIVWRWALNGQSGMVNATLYDFGAIRAADRLAGHGRHRLSDRDRDRHSRFDPVLGHGISGRPILTPCATYSRPPASTAPAAGSAGGFSLSPLIRPFINIVLVLNFIYVFNSFPLIWVMTQGDPANSTDILVTWLYKLAFRYGKLDIASALSIVMFLILLAFTIVYAILAMRNERETA